jgi:hypothetical protein
MNSNTLTLEAPTLAQINAERKKVWADILKETMIQHATRPILGGMGDTTAVLPGMAGEVTLTLFDAADLAGRRNPVNVWDIIPTEQARTIRSLSRGEEGAFFRGKVADVRRILDTMPQARDTDGLGDSALVYLHYFTAGADWYITERDIETEQLQAFGLADLGYGGELGYISLVEICRCSSANLDLHWTPKTLADVRQA